MSDEPAALTGAGPAPLLPEGAFLPARGGYPSCLYVR